MDAKSGYHFTPLADAISLPIGEGSTMAVKLRLRLGNDVLDVPLTDQAGTENRKLDGTFHDNLFLFHFGRRPERKAPNQYRPGVPPPSTAIAVP